jgi:elongator complex protein 1
MSAALRVIADLKDKNSELVPRAVEHICFLADVNRLYDEALGLYRLDITLLIAQKSQKVVPTSARTDDRIQGNIFRF